MTPPEFTPDKRRGMTKARKLRIWTRDGGACWVCKAPVPVTGPGVAYDHREHLWLKGSDADEDISPICEPCHAVKTAADARVRAKVKRIIKKNAGLTPKKNPIRSRGFSKGHRPMTNGKGKRPWPKKIKPV